MTCRLCHEDYSRDCPACQQNHQSTPLRLLTKMPWKTHVPVWNERAGQPLTMSCGNCGKSIPPETTMRELYGPCSAQTEQAVSP